MALDESPPLRAKSVLRVLDQVADHVIEAHALVMTLPANKRGELRAAIDVLLTALGQQIAAELPRSALEGDPPDLTRNA